MKKNIPVEEGLEELDFTRENAFLEAQEKEEAEQAHE